MHYYIDGYNLLFRLMPEENEKLQMRRESIIQDLNKKMSLLHLKASLVFDAPYQAGKGSQSHYDVLEILYTSAGQSADEYILEKLKYDPHPEQQTVVTSDKKLAWLARLRAAHTESVEDFMFRIDRAYQNKLRKEKQKTPTRTSPPKIPQQKSLAPQKNTHLEKCEEYYNQIFESRFEESLKEEETLKQKKILNQAKNPPPRRPKKRPDPFPSPEPIEKKEASELERWLKIFERRSFNDPE